MTEKEITIAERVLIVLLVCAIGIGLMIMRQGLQKEEVEEHEPALREYYALTATVVALEEYKDTVVCEDEDGNLWAFTGIEKWCVGDSVNLLMNSCGTATIYDDAVIGAEYSEQTLAH